MTRTFILELNLGLILGLNLMIETAIRKKTTSNTCEQLDYKKVLKSSKLL